MEICITCLSLVVILGYIVLSDCPAVLEPPAGARDKSNLLLKYFETPHKRRCHERDYISTKIYILYLVI